MTRTDELRHVPGGRRRTVLISGASIAGPALAFWLNRYGFAVTVVEKAGRSAAAATPSTYAAPRSTSSGGWGSCPDCGTRTSICGD